MLRQLLGIPKLDQVRSLSVQDELCAQNIVREIEQYEQKWRQHLDRTDTNRTAKQALQYKPKGRRNIRRPKNRWKD